MKPFILRQTTFHLLFKRDLSTAAYRADRQEDGTSWLLTRESHRGLPACDLLVCSNQEDAQSLLDWFVQHDLLVHAAVKASSSEVWGQLLVKAAFSLHRANSPEPADINTETAAAMFNVPAEEVTSSMRERAKVINYAQLYSEPTSLEMPPVYNQLSC